ncbi:MAG: rRNA maturation RNase YbeY [Planctomycetota bacterium]
MHITVTNQQELLQLDASRLESAARAILQDANRLSGGISIVVVDDATIRPLNAEFLGHDYETDVLSFAIEDRGDHLEGEVIVSAETAITNAADYGWPAEHELLLYVIHGVLHLVGYRDKADADVADMRHAEAKYLDRFGVSLPATTQQAAERNLGADPVEGASAS